MQQDSIYEFSFNEFRLLKLNFEMKLDKKTKIDEGVNVSGNLGIKYNITKEKTLRLYLTVDICGEELPFTLNIEVGGLFIFSKVLKNSPELDKIARINCAAIVFPYLREIAADVIRRSGLPAIHLPPINFVDIYRSQVESKKEARKAIK